MTALDLELASEHGALVPDVIAPNARVPDAPGPGAALRRSARNAVTGAVVLGVAGDLLLRAADPGVNLLICTALGLGLLAWLARARGRPLTVGAVALGALALGFAAAIAWRASPTLLLLNLLALATTACALAAAVRHGDALPIESAELGAYARGAAATVGSVITGAPALVRPVIPTRTARGRQVTGALRVGARGTALALPALVVFGTLLAAADGAFARLAARLVDWDVDVLVAHVLFASVVAWGAAGYLRGALFPAATPAAAAGAGVARLAFARRPAVDAAEWCVALVLVDVLFVAFGVVQLGWLFGGRALVASSGVTYAEYARRGFFELVAVAALALPTALGAYGAGVRRLARDDPRAPRLHRALRLAAGTLLGCLGVVLVSAADRMRLYQGAYGQTELRFYTTAFMGWLAVVGACAAVTVLRDRRAPFALGTVAAGWAWVLALDAADPGARIVATNVARATVARPLDVAYAASLDADAVPTLLAALAASRTASAVHSAEDLCTVAQQLDAMRRDASANDWRSWNAGRSRALRAIGAAERDGRLTSWRAGCARP